MNATAIILAGGKSSRMGTNKALLKIAEKTNVERIVEELQGVFSEIILVTNEPDDYSFLEVKKIMDQYPGRGPLAGIHAGLSASNTEVNFFVACDMPFVSADLSTHFIEKSKAFDAVVPVINGKQHPLFAVYKKSLMQETEACLKNNNLRIRDLLEKIHVLYVTEEDIDFIEEASLNRVFFNMNHPNEYKDAKKWAEEEK